MLSLKNSFIVGYMLLLLACSHVEPWERDVLAREGMQLTSDTMEAYSKEHVYFSKEAATGGTGVGGGGCGCN